MPQLSDRANLNRATSIRSNATVSNSVSGARPINLFRFDLGNAGPLNLKFRSSGAAAQLRVLRDRNNNGRLDAGEVVASSRLKANGQATMAKLEAGTYFIQVAAQSRKTTQYRLQLVPTQLETQPGNPSGGATSGANDFKLRVVQLTNEYRQSQKLAPLKLNSELAIAAQRHSEEMVSLDFFDHSSPDGRKPENRTAAAGYKGRYTGENIAAGSSTPEDVVRGWINSPGHRENILNPNAREIGIGYIYSASDSGRETWRYYWTQIFGG
jgi:uncharacterized protein YkwD